MIKLIRFVVSCWAVPLYLCTRLKLSLHPIQLFDRSALLIACQFLHSNRTLVKRHSLIGHLPPVCFRRPQQSRAGLHRDGYHEPPNILPVGPFTCYDWIVEPCRWPQVRNSARRSVTASSSSNQCSRGHSKFCISASKRTALQLHLVSSNKKFPSQASLATPQITTPYLWSSYAHWPYKPRGFEDT